MVQDVEVSVSSSHEICKERYRFFSALDGWASGTTLRSELRYNPLRIFQWPGKAIAGLCSRRAAEVAERESRDGLRTFAVAHGEKKVSDFIRTIALYLPQFHAIPENDAWWGPGFTEWSNVRKAKPLFPGHVQPHVPHPDLGYYDLSDVEVMRRQAAMAKEYGLSGFCFYYYHFKDGKRLLEKPLENWLAAKDIDFPFCYAWANENWTRAWNGGESEVIMPQDYDEANLRAMLSDMIRAFRDPRYIKVDGGRKPVLLVYRAEIIPQIASVAAVWRKMAVEAGFDGLYLVSMQNFRQVPPAELGFDASVEFASFKGDTPAFDRRSPQGDDIGFRPGLPRFAKYAQCVDRVRQQRCAEYVRYKMCCPGWDNTPRKDGDGFAVVGNTPELFADAYRACVRQTLADARLRENGFVFVNAWNEWGEGAHLEPDERNGYAYLEQVRSVMAARVSELCGN